MSKTLTKYFISLSLLITGSLFNLGASANDLHNKLLENDPMLTGYELEKWLDERFVDELFLEEDDCLDINQAIPEHGTALEIAARQNRHRWVEALTNAPGFNIDATNLEGNTALGVMVLRYAEAGTTERESIGLMIRLLIHAGTNVNHVTNNQPLSPLNLAAERGLTDLVELMHEAAILRDSGDEIQTRDKEQKKKAKAETDEVLRKFAEAGLLQHPELDLFKETEEEKDDEGRNKWDSGEFGHLIPSGFTVSNVQEGEWDAAFDDDDAEGATPATTSTTTTTTTSHQSDDSEDDSGWHSSAFNSDSDDTTTTSTSEDSDNGEPVHTGLNIDLSILRDSTNSSETRAADDRSPRPNSPSVGPSPFSY